MADLKLRTTEAYFYALGRKHEGSGIDPTWFAAAYESAKESWRNSSGDNRKKWIGVSAYYEEYKKLHTRNIA